MRVVIVGSGGREHALGWSMRRHGHQVDLISAGEVDELLAAEDDRQPDLVVPGPEQVLVDGLADRCAAANVACFGPTAALARLESSKGYARELATLLGIPGPRFRRFTSGQQRDAIDWWGQLGTGVVVKLDGLAGGKGVTVPVDDAETRTAIAETEGDFVLEERMTGPEVSLLALCAGRNFVALPLAQDHKRIGEADTGPNTGGMGAIAPAPFDLDPEALGEIFIQPILDHFADAGTPYLGVLYAGLMLTPSGPRLIEYNVRFGDPETQAILPLVETDLAELMATAVRGQSLEPLQLKSGGACAVVAAAPGYPATPQLGADVSFPEHLLEGHGDAVLFPAGLTTDHRTSGGRVLAVTGTGEDLGAARKAAYRALEEVRFDSMYVRRDIGWRVPGAQLGSYAAAGVDIDEGQRAVEAITQAVERTHTPAVVAGLGSFGGAFSAAAIKAMDDPLLIASTDGVGTKVELAARAGNLGGIGADLVNHCINDVLVQGARPLFFLDYLASSALRAEMVAEVVTSMAAACEASGCALLGGETAEMPGVYAPGALDVAGTLVGVVERRDLLPRPDLEPGDVLIAVASSGPHTNGYSLIRKLIDWLPLDVQPEGFEVSLGEALLIPHRSYLAVLAEALATEKVLALAHITGGGLPDNLPRILPEGIGARIELGSWPMPPLFAFLQQAASGLEVEELYRTLNMGVGMVVVCRPDDVATVQGAIDEETWVIGELIPDDRRVSLV